MNSTKRVMLFVLLIAAVAMIARFWDVLMLFLAAGIIAYILSPLAGLLQKKTHMRRGLAVFIVLFFFVVLIVGIVSLSLPRAIVQISGLVGEIQSYASDFDSLLDSGVHYLTELGLPEPVIDTLIGLLAESDGYISSFLTGILTAIVNFSLRLFDGVVIVILVVYFMLDGQRLLHAFLSTLPESLRERAHSVVRRADRVTWTYIKTRVLISAGMAVCTYFGLRIIGLDYALLFAFLSFVLDFVPYFGSILAGVLEAFFALITLGLGPAIAVGVFVLVVQQIEGNVVIPKIQGDQAGIHPITVMFAILASSELWGPAGMLIAVPIAAILKIVVTEVYYYIVTPDDWDPRQMTLEEGAAKEE